MDARKRLIIIKGKDQTDSVASFQFHDGKCEVVYTSAPNKSYSFQSSNVEILPLKNLKYLIILEQHMIETVFLLTM